MKIEVDVEDLNAIYQNARSAQDEDDSETVNHLMDRIIGIHERIAKAYPDAGLRRRLDRRIGKKGKKHA